MPQDGGQQWFWRPGAPRLEATQIAIPLATVCGVDLEHGDQPMANEDGTVVTVYNGEIWNHEGQRIDPPGSLEEKFSRRLVCAVRYKEDYAVP